MTAAYASGTDVSDDADGTKGRAEKERVAGAVRKRRLNRSLELSHVGFGYRSEVIDGLNGGVSRFGESFELAPLLQIKRRYDAEQIGQVRRLDLQEANRPRSPLIVLPQVEPRIGDGFHGRG
eukprot:6187752-Pleurochrysis_carterae.AAC.1